MDQRSMTDHVTPAGPRGPKKNTFIFHRKDLSDKAILRIMVKPTAVAQIRGVYPESPIPDPALFPFADSGSGIPDPRGGGKNLFYLFCSHKFHKIEKYFILNTYSYVQKKPFEPIDKDFKYFYPKHTRKIVTKVSEIWVGNLGFVCPQGSGKKIFPGSRIWIQRSRKYRSPDLDPQHCTRQA